MTRLIPINGKGGVGKTTNSCSLAVALADAGYRVMLMSTDPAASVGDSLGQDIGRDPVKVKGVDNLWAIEVDGSYEYDKLYEYVKHNTKGIEKFLGKTGVPGMSEVAALFRVFTYLYDLDYDVIIVDTPPTGHALQMFGLPETIDNIATGVQKLLKSFNSVKSFFEGMVVPVEEKRKTRIQGIKDCVGLLSETFADSETTYFNLVSTAEYMSLKEEVRALYKFREYGIETRNVILNRLQPKNPGCPYCMSRWAENDAYVKSMSNKFETEGVGIIRIVQRPEEVRGIAALRSIGKDLVTQMKGLDIRRSYRVIPDGGNIWVETELPMVQKQNLKAEVRGNQLIVRIGFGLHEEVPNVIVLPRHATHVEAMERNKRLTFRVW